VPRIRFDQVDEKCSHIVIVLLEMHAVYEVAQENLAHLPHENSDLGSARSSEFPHFIMETTSSLVYTFSYLPPSLSLSFIGDRF